MPLANDNPASVLKINAICSIAYQEEFTVIPKRPEDFGVDWFNDVLELGGAEVIDAKGEYLTTPGQTADVAGIDVPSPIWCETSRV